MLSTGGMIKKNALLWELFEKVNSWLAASKIPYYITYGTLLGYFREGTIIDHDIDIDFGMHLKDAERFKAYARENPPPFKLHDTTWRHHGPKFYMALKGFDADIYFFDHQGNELIIPLEKTHWKNYQKPISSKNLLPLRQVQFNDVKTYVPAKTEAYLKSIYGNLSASAVRNTQTHFWEAPKELE